MNTQQALLNLAQIPKTPIYIIDIEKIETNCKVLQSVEQTTGCKVLLALKGFASFCTFPTIKKYLSGITASGLHEALLGEQFFGKEIHVYSPAYKANELKHLTRISDSIIFNSVAQWKRYQSIITKAKRPIQFGLRVNPEYSEVDTEIYNPCAKGSRLGITSEQLSQEPFSNGISGLHFHALCEQNSYALAHTLKAFEHRFASYLPKLNWVNFGGGHHITREDYDVEHLIQLINNFKKRYNLQVYLEPGEAVALNAGVLVTEVLDFVVNGDITNVILDTSATTHMPDVLEMPYRPEIVGADLPGKQAHTYRLGGLSCLAGDIIGDYSFAQPLKIGDRLSVLDMAHYSIVKNTSFNGVPLPAIGVYKQSTNALKIVKKFAYSDYRNRLS